MHKFTEHSLTKTKNVVRAMMTTRGGTITIDSDVRNGSYHVELVNDGFVRDRFWGDAYGAVKFIEQLRTRCMLGVAKFSIETRMVTREYKVKYFNQNTQRDEWEKRFAPIPTLVHV